MPRKNTTIQHKSSQSVPPTVSGSWLLKAAGISVVGAGFCAWLTLCLLFWQGSWQLLYRPSSTVARTPASVGLDFDPVAFATSDEGVPRLTGWWIPAAPDGKYSRYTVLYLHGQVGNMGDTVSDLAALHGLGLNVLAFDYRGYGQSQFVHPSEAHWREDAEWALGYLTGTRHLDRSTILLDGRDLGANLALEVGAVHADLGGVVLESPLASPMETIFNDPRARLVPARLLVSDRFDMERAGSALLIPSLWVMDADARKNADGYERITARKMTVWLKPGDKQEEQFADGFSRWLDDQMTGAAKAKLPPGL